MAAYLLTPSEGQEQEQNVARLNKFDRQMRKLNLTDIHFSDPKGIVVVDTVINRYRPHKEDVIVRMKQVINETAEMMKKSLTSNENKEEWMQRLVDVPRPITTTSRP